MVDFKVCINDPKTGKSYAREVKGEAAETFVGKIIGDKIAGEAIDLTGYEFEVTGGSDDSGFPMRKDVDTIRKKIMAVEGVGIKKTSHGMRHRKTVSGNKIHPKISQINLKIIKYGKQKLGEEAKENMKEEKKGGGEEKKEEKKEVKEKAKEEKKEETPKEKKE